MFFCSDSCSVKEKEKKRRKIKGPNWSSIKLHESDSESQPVSRSKRLKSTNKNTIPRMMQEFSQAGADGAPHIAEREQFQSVVPRMASHESQDVDMDVGSAPGRSLISTKDALISRFVQRHPQ